ncbi:MAG: TPM domain-containing protein [Epsilonproteobacteria bacterium]|nr:TPM domain-containing protein [Campylobacterota bacterium]
MRSSFLRALALFFIPLFAAENFIIKNEEILPQKTVQKINEIGNELAQKSGVRLYLAAVKKMPTKKIIDFEKRLAKGLEPPFVLLAIATEDQKVDIYSSKETSKLFDKEEILSPLPWKGSIIPLLTSHSKDQHAAVEAALLNGYAEIAEQIASSKGVSLKSAIGNTNRNIYYWLRILFYSIIALIFVNMIYRRVVQR